MEMYPDILRRQIDSLNGNLWNLSTKITSASKSSNELQKKLTFWTKIMAFAIIIQAIAIIVQIAVIIWTNLT